MADKNIEAIHKFLLDHNFESTAEALIQEASKMGFQTLEYKLGEVTDPYVQLIQCYNTGDYSTFFQLWNNLFSSSIKQCEEYKKLTFYLHVYFAVLPKRKLHTNQYKKYGKTDNDLPSETNTLKLSSIENDLLEKCKENNAVEIEQNINSSMKQLQDYLDGDGKELEYDTELQPFYALPFIEDLYTNTYFSKMLEQHWADELLKNLHSFITRHRQNLVQVHTTMPATKTIVMESDVAQNKTKKIKNNIPIVPNDRDLPIFLDHDEEQYCFSNKTNLKSKSTQTHITGSQITMNNLPEDIINPEESVSRLLKMHKSDKRLIQYNRELVVTKSHLCSIHTNYEKLKMRFHKLHADYHKLIDVAGELTMALENSVKGQDVDIQRTLEICMKIFPDLFNQNIRETSYPSLLQLDRIDVKAITLPKLDVTAVPISPKLLDYKKIKLHLINGDVKTKLLLLQALRWKITLVQSAEQDEILHEYISRDLLGLHGQIASDNGKSILPCLLTAGEAYARHLLQQFTARLLNTLASFRCGRDYLSVGSSVINVTFACLDNNYADGVDPFACDMMVAMLQKLSLRRQQRIYMIESGLLEWLINHLHDKCRIISLYRLEYATALLMNLSLHRLAQARASKISSLLMSTLIVLLSIDHTSSLPYINGALNNFLNNPVINEEARKIKRSNISEYLGNNQKSTEIRKHLDHVLRIQRCENVNTPQNDETGDDDNEDLDVLESELDENDPLQNYIGELNGETLLAMCYSVSSKISQDTVNTDTTLQQISTLNSIDFYGNQHKNHVCNKHPSYHTLRYNIKVEKEILPKESYTKQAIFTKLSDLSNFSLKEQQIVTNGTKKSFSTHKVQNIAKKIVDTESSLIMRYNNQPCKKQEKNITVLKNIIWPANAIRKNNRYEFDYDKQFRTEVNSRFRINNNIQYQSKLCRLEDKINTRKLYDEKFRKTKLEKLSLETMKSFKRNFTERTIPNDTIYLYKNRTSNETAVTSSTVLVPGRENGQAEIQEKFSSIASLNSNNCNNNIINDISWKNDPELAKEEEAFLAKPKLSRTPP
ncbi:PREDICTED: lisH domain-containing protein ARMC9-like isoform X2 [Trachymyrmex septentrionalis]|uniref:lisH domain-containing protein ARMC9-like isoform X2 n=1 Tax=Trachymyrmex septentrionalis TaxID=34720 RepID=UPI00084F3292|nr:PREDICTED: lisH domain-containing protein ARMC9-like isoform X2 [Trachymyrmex septentrionalis]